MEIPNGKKHLEFVERAADITKLEVVKNIEDLSQEQELLGVALNALYQVATCHRKCFGGGHLLEALSGRIYNLAVSAYHLSMIGLYDEALSLIRSIGEIANLISLSTVDKAAFSGWITSDKNTRMRKYSPAKIRKALEDKGGVIMADQNWYSEFCERYTHVTPQTIPNLHSQEGLGFVGGIHDSNGLEKVLGELSTIVSAVSIYISKYAELDDKVLEIAKAANIEPEVD